MFRCLGVQVFRCSGVQVFRCSGVQVFRCLGFRVQGGEENLDETVFGWNCRGWNCQLFLDESVFGRVFFLQSVPNHFCGDDNTAEVDLGTIISVNQLSIHGAVADICDELAWRISGCSESTRKTCCSVQFGDYGDASRSVDNEPDASDQWKGARKLAARLWTKNRKSSRSSSIDQTVVQCKFREDCGEMTVFHDPRQCGS